MEANRPCTANAPSGSITQFKATQSCTLPDVRPEGITKTIALDSIRQFKRIVDSSRTIADALTGYTRLVDADPHLLAKQLTSPEYNDASPEFWAVAFESEDAWQVLRNDLLNPLIGQLIEDVELIPGSTFKNEGVLFLLDSAFQTANWQSIFLPRSERVSQTFSKATLALSQYAKRSNDPEAPLPPRRFNVDCFKINRYTQKIRNWLLRRFDDGVKSRAPGWFETNPTMRTNEPKSQPDKRRGRLPKAEGDAMRATMLATLRQHPSLKDDPAGLAEMIGTSESSVRRWMEEEEEKYRDSRAANYDPDEVRADE